MKQLSLTKRSWRPPRRAANRRILVWLVLAIVLIAELVWLFRNQYLLIQKVALSGSETVSQTAAEDLVRRTLVGNYWGIFPRRHAWWYPRREIKTELLKTFPALAAVSITRKDFTTLTLAVTERRGRYLWCGRDRPDCFLLDESGLAFAAAPSFSVQPFLEFKTEFPGAPLGTRPLDADTFSALLNSVDVLSRRFAATALAGFQVYKIEASAEADFRFFVRPPPEAEKPGFTVLINLRQPLSEVETVLQTALAAEAFIAEWQLIGHPLEYLDLRFPGKMFYKFAE